MQTPCFDTLDDGLRKLRAVDSWNDLRDVVRDTIAPFGGDDFAVKLDPARQEAPAPGRLLSSLPESITRLFQQPDFSVYDPVNRRFVTSQLPQSWQPETQSTADAPAVYAFLHRLGIRHGLSLQQRSQQLTSRVDFYSRGEDWAGPAGAIRGVLVYLGMYVHEAAAALWRKQAEAAEQGNNGLLSARELECLHWGALGKTSREIGMILGISQRTVYFHLTNAASKLNVYSVKHAISRALSSGLVRIGA